MMPSLVSRFAKQAAAVAGAIAMAALVGGCPVYSDNSYGRIGCYFATDCPLGQRCTADGYCVAGPAMDGGGAADGGAVDARIADGSVDGASNADAVADVPSADIPSNVEGATPIFCANPNDCPNETCSSDGTCRPGDCSTSGCVNGFQCAVVTGGPSAIACVHADSLACGADHQCPQSARCVDGKCTPLADLCTDRAQCPAGNACVDGKCIVTCTTDSQCPSGSLCRLALEICDAKAKSCSRTSDCASPELVCVDGGCVPRCGAVGACGDAGASACVDNGCIASQKPRSICQTDGSTAGCGAGQICFHHACYTSCQSPNGAACDALPATSGPAICKNVTVGAATYAICGSAVTLGSECDPTTTDKVCAADETCIDGYCK